ncbi:MAG TPA: serine/threonine-protein kinase [Halomicronema sp.]
MNYCININCEKPQNPQSNKFCQSCGMRLLVREHFRVIKPLGNKEFTRTFLAVDEDLPSKPFCVIKQFFPPENIQKEQARERFEREALQLDVLGKNPQIPQLLAFFELQGQQYLVQEFIEGESLVEELQKKGAFNETDIRVLLGDLLSVLEFVHGNSVVHRDIKPENVIRRKSDRRLVLVDFGASKVVGGGNRVATILGSPEYVAPEQLQGRPVFASDLYSLGVMCVQLLTKESPFNLRRGGEWVWREFLLRPVSAVLGEILDKLLADSLQVRYSSAVEVLQDLTKVRPQLWKALQTLSTVDKVRCVAVSSDGQFVAAGGEENSVKLWNIGGDLKVRSLGNLLSGHSGWVNSIAFSADGQLLVSGSCDRTIKIWNLGTGKLVKTLGSWFSKDWGWVYSVAVWGDFLVSGHGDRLLRVWSLGTGKLLGSFAGHSGWVESVAFRPDGKVVASGSGDRSVKVWNVASGDAVLTLTGHSEGVSSVAFSGDGQVLVSGSGDGTVRLWQLASAELLTCFSHSGPVVSVAVSPDGQAIAGGGRNGVVQLWNPYTGEMLVSFRYPGVVSSLGFSGDGQVLVVGGLSGKIGLWRLMSGGVTGT